MKAQSKALLLSLVLLSMKMGGEGWKGLDSVSIRITKLVLILYRSIVCT